VERIVVKGFKFDPLSTAPAGAKPAAPAPDPTPRPARSRSAVVDTVIAEAAGEGAKGMQAVAGVIKNRAEKRGLDPDAVVKQPKQFTGYEHPGSGAKAAQRDPKIRAEAERIVDGVMTGALPDITGGADHYHADYVKPGWAGGLKKTAKIGQHEFYTSGGEKKRRVGGAGSGKANWANVATLGDPSDPTWQKHNLTTIEPVKGQKWTVYKPAAAAFNGLLSDLAAQGYNVKSSGGYNYRNIRGSNKLSQHAFGTAIDLNAAENPLGGGKSNLPPNIRELAAKHGLVWGGDFKGRKDPMHFEYAGEVGDTSVDYGTTGSVTKGPNGIARIVVNKDTKLAPESLPSMPGVNTFDPMARFKADPVASVQSTPDNPFAQLNEQRAAQGLKPLIQMPASQYEKWKTKYDADQPGVFSDIGNLLVLGAQMPGHALRAVVRALPGGESIDAAMSSVDEWMTGSPTDKLFKEETEEYTKALSQKTQAARQKDWWDSENGKLGAAWTDPRAYLSGIVESIPSTVLTMGPAQLLMRGSVKAAIAAGLTKEAAAAQGAKTALLAGGVGEGLLAGGSTAEQVRAELDALPQEVWDSSDSYKALIEQGMSPEDAKSTITSDSSAQAGLIAGVSTGLVGGRGDMVLGEILGKGLAGGLKKRLVKGAVKEGAAELLEETVQSGSEQVATNIGVGNADPNRPVTQGVANAMLGGAVTGGIMGGGMGAVAGAASPEEGAAPPPPPAGAPPPAGTQTAPAGQPLGGGPGGAGPVDPTSRGVAAGAGLPAHKAGPIESALSHGEMQAQSEATAQAVQRGASPPGTKVEVNDGEGDTFTGTVKGYSATGDPIVTADDSNEDYTIGQAFVKPLMRPGKDITLDPADIAATPGQGAAPEGAAAVAGTETPAGENAPAAASTGPVVTQRPDEAHKAPAEEPAQQFPRVRPAGVADWISEPIERARDVADKTGLTAEIERLSAERMTAHQVATALKDKINKVAAVGDERLFVLQVRASLGIPSQDSYREFEDWLKGRAPSPGIAPPAAEAAPASSRSAPAPSPEAAPTAPAPAPVAEKAPRPLVREVFNPSDGEVKKVKLPDATHARIYDLAIKRVQAREQGDMGQRGLDAADPVEQQAIADELKISLKDAGNIVDDYRYRVERATAEGKKPPVLNTDLIARRQKEHAEKQKQASPAAPPPAAKAEAAAAPRPSQEPVAAAAQTTVATFKTAMGSVYQVHADGTTTRDKAPRSTPGHEGDSGPKARSSRTVYFKASAGDLSPAGLTPVPDFRVLLKDDNTATLVTWNSKEKRWGVIPGARDVPFSNEPAKGLYPLEVAKPMPAERTDTMEVYNAVHAGNQIVEFTPTEAATAEADVEPQAEPAAAVTETPPPSVTDAVPDAPGEAPVDAVPGKKFRKKRAKTAEETLKDKLTEIFTESDEDREAAEAEVGDILMKARLEEGLIGYDPVKDNHHYGQPGDWIFPTPKKTIDPAKGVPTISEDRGQEIIDEWKSIAKRIGKQRDNSKKVIISLFDSSGSWSQPFRDAGYHVVQIDIDHGEDIFETSPTVIQSELEEALGPDYTVAGVISACPCTTFASSGSQWWPTKHDEPNPAEVLKLFGPKAAMLFDTPVAANTWMVHMTAYYIDLFKPKFHALENPRGRIARMSGLPPALMRFDPSDFGDSYTKETRLWGSFNTDLPVAPVEAAQGSKIHKLRGDNAEDKAERSLTPDGFAYAFFLAQDQDGRNAIEALNQPKAPSTIQPAPPAPTGGVKRTIPRDTSLDTTLIATKYTDHGIDVVIGGGLASGDAAKDVVMSRGKANGNENMVVLDVNGDVVANGEGRKSRVALTERVWSIFTDPNEKVIIHHNHPSDLSLSEPDISAAALPGVTATYAHAPNGISYRVAVTPVGSAIMLDGAKLDYRGADAMAVVTRRLDAWNKPIFRALQNAIMAGQTNAKFAGEEYHHIVNSALHDGGMVVYDAIGRGPSTLMDIPEVKAAYEKVVAKHAERIAAAGTHRPTEPIRHPGDLAVVQGRNGAAAPRPAAGRDAGAGTGPAAKPSEDRPAPKEKPAKKLSKAAQARVDATAKLAKYFTPGNIVRSYGGHDRVVRFFPPDAKGNWFVKVEAVIRRDDGWIADPQNKRVRQHATMPSVAELRDGPVDTPKAAAPIPEPTNVPQAGGLWNTGLETFKKWFGKSVVTQPDGKPKVMYHGSIVWSKDGKKLGDFDFFNRLASVEIVGRKRSMDTVGAWFSDLPSGGGSYAGQEGTVYPVYLKIENPWRPATFDDFLDQMQSAAGNDPREIRRVHGDSGEIARGSTEPLRGWLKAQGYDGIVFPRGTVDMKEQQVWVALDPEQIKSVFNSGAFNPASPKMLEARTPNLKPSGYQTDNPGGDWLAGKKRNAEREMMKGESGWHGLGGTPTAFAGMKKDLFLPVSELRKLPGRNREKPAPGQVKYDDVIESVKDKGYTNENPVFVMVNHRGEAFLNEGNNRTAVAAAVGIKRIKAWVHWMNGAEETPGDWDPDHVAQMEEDSKDLEARVPDFEDREVPKSSVQADGDSPVRISTRFPDLVSKTEDPIAERLVVSTESMKAEPNKGAFRHNMRIIASYVNMPRGIANRSADHIATVFKEHIKDNLRWLYNQIPAEQRNRTKLWYDGARKITDDWMKRYKLPDHVIAGVLAALSPQKDWYQNVSLAERVLDIMTFRSKSPWTNAMGETGYQLFEKPDKVAWLNLIRGKTLDQIAEQYADHVKVHQLQAMWVRIYDQTYHDPRHREVSSEGNFVGELVDNVAWGSLSEIGKAVAVIRDPDYANVSRRMGMKHKVRNFFNNILAPKARHGDITIDTHAVAAALLRALSGASYEVNHNFGTSPPKEDQDRNWRSMKNVGISGTSGSYGLIADAHRELAAELGILPRELQSITWEAVRGLFTSTFKAQARNVAAIDAIWQRVRNGEITAQAARSEILRAAGGIVAPSWYRPGARGDVGIQPSTYERTISGVGLRQGSAKGVDGGARGGTAGDVSEPGLEAPDIGRLFRGVVTPVINTIAHPTEQRFLDRIKSVWSKMTPAALGAVYLNYFPDLAPASIKAHVEDYIKEKRIMDTFRDGIHRSADKTVQKWRKLAARGGRAHAVNLALLMHDATKAETDPDDLNDMLKPDYADLRNRFLALPTGFQELYREVRDSYTEQNDKLDQILLANVQEVQDIADRKRERQLGRKLRDADLRHANGLTTAAEHAEERRLLNEAADRERLQGRRRTRSTVAELRLRLETNKLKPPYFPLGRFGTYFVSERDAAGKLVHFALAESQFEMQENEKAVRAGLPAGHTVETGVLPEKTSDQTQAAKPSFIAEIEQMLPNIPTKGAIMDAIWQRYLRTMPAQSVRSRKLHRKMIEGHSADALRVYANHMFHAAHQMARLQHGLKLEDLTDQAAEAAREAPQDQQMPATRLSDELNKRHKWVMNPTGKNWAQWASMSAFAYYLGLSPAAAMVNLAQTPMVGIPVLAGRFGSMTKAAAAITRAAKNAISDSGLNNSEEAAMRAWEESGVIDRTQSVDIQGVGETGLTYSPTKSYVMAKLGILFHKAEVINRRVTALAAFRLAIEEGRTPAEAIDIASDMTWRTHFDYSNSSRPRMMQGPVSRVLMSMRSYQVNMIYRLGRDIHQSFKGDTPQARREARYQLGGILGMQALVAGGTAVAGYNTAFFAYGVMSTLFAAIFGGDEPEDDPFEVQAKFESAVLDMFGPVLGNVILHGAVGAMTGVDLTSRVGMPDIWFRSPNKDLETGEDTYLWLLTQMVGAPTAIVEKVLQGAYKIPEEGLWSGVQTASPKVFKDLMKAYGLMTEGLVTGSGETVMAPEDVGWWAGISQAMGFTPAHLAEQWAKTGAMKSAERRIKVNRQAYINSYAAAVKTGDTEGRVEALAKIRSFNKSAFGRTMPIKSSSLSASVKHHAIAEAQRKRGDGVYISNEALRRRLESGLPGYAE
jgi:spore germination cell wall hydrolase CwlJ-like protein